MNLGKRVLVENITIAIDGPAASGKSTAGLMLAKRLGLIFFDTGIMYRVITWAVLDLGIDIFNEEKVNDLARNIEIEINAPSIEDGRINDVILNGKDISLKIRNPEVNQNVSQISTYSGVRESLTQQQRMIASKGSIVMAGRDIGTVVLPDANFKFYLEASLAVRAERRRQELKGNKFSDEIVQSLLRRDKIDSNRAIAPLKPADDAIIINTENKTLEQVVEFMYEIVLSGKKIIP